MKNIAFLVGRLQYALIMSDLHSNGPVLGTIAALIRYTLKRK